MGCPLFFSSYGFTGGTCKRDFNVIQCNENHKKVGVNMDAVLCLTMGYFIGSFSPASLLSKIKNVDLRKEGSGNLGATNTLVVMGFRSGLLVLLADLLKTIFSERLARVLFPQLYFAGLIAACGAVIGHIFPFYLKFQGGKGVACLAGMVLTFDFGLFVFLLTLGIGVMFLLNYGVYVPVAVSAIFPLFVWKKTGSGALFMLTAVTGALIIYKHRENFRKIKAGEETKVRSFFGERLAQRRLEAAGSDNQDEYNNDLFS